MSIPPLLTSLFSAAEQLHHYCPKQQSDLGTISNLSINQHLHQSIKNEVKLTPKLENVNSILCRYHISTTTSTNRLHPPRRIPLRRIIPPPSLRIRPHTQDNGPSPRRLIRELVRMLHNDQRRRQHTRRNGPHHWRRWLVLSHR